MQEIIFQDLDRSHIWEELIDKQYNYNLVHRFNPDYAVEWWNGSMQLQNIELANVQVRQMQVDLQVDLSVLKQLIFLNTHYLFIYQFSKPVPGSLLLENIPVSARDNILRQNEMRLSIEIQMDIVTVSSFDTEYIDRLKSGKFAAAQIKNNA